MAEGGADIWLEPVTPFDPNDYAKHYERHYTTPSMMFYLERINRKGQDAKIGRDLVEAMWSGGTPPEHLIAAETFLPFGSMTALDRKGFLAELPETTTRRPLRVAAISPFYRPGFLSFLTQRAKTAGIQLEFTPVTFKEYLDLISDYDKASPFDFVLSPYMASERYPAVEVRYILNGREVPYDLELLDSPETTAGRKQMLTDIQRWMLSSQSAVPLYFTTSVIKYKRGLNIGAQPKTDADLQLWRVEL